MSKLAFIPPWFITFYQLPLATEYLIRHRHGFRVSRKNPSHPVGVIKRPPSGWPVVVFNHGYIPPDQYRTTERYVAYVAAFAHRGYIVFKPDYRGHGFSEGTARGGYGKARAIRDAGQCPRPFDNRF